MNYSVDHAKNIPAYMQLYNQLQKDISEGVFSYGAKLPSKRIIAEETQVSIVTVEHALDILAEEGYIEARQRSGYYVIYRKSDFLSVRTNEPAAQRMRSAEKKTEKASAGPGTFPFSVMAKTMRRVLSDMGDDIFEKSPGNGCEVLRNELCAYLARSIRLHIQPEQVVVGSGAEYLYGLIAQLLQPSSKFALENPSYSKIRKVYESFGIECDMLDLTENGIDSAQLRNTEANVLHVTPFHSYPSRVTADISKKIEYLAWAAHNNGFIIEDNYDSELTVSRKAEDPLFLMSDKDNVIYLNTFSHTIAPSIRIGYMVLPKQLTGVFREKLGFYSCTVPVFEQYVLAELLRTGDYERHINRMRRARRRESPLS